MYLKRENIEPMIGRKTKKNNQSFWKYFWKDESLCSNSWVKWWKIPHPPVRISNIEKYADNYNWENIKFNPKEKIRKVWKK